MYCWRITKYNPIYRSEDGNYLKKEWTSIFDVGKSFDGKKLSLKEYLLTEDLYIKAIIEFINFLRIPSLKACELEKYEESIQTDKYPEIYTIQMIKIFKTIKNEDDISVNKIGDLVKLILREHLWCKLENKNKMFIHFGYDYYMYIGSYSKCDYIINKIKEMGLFVEKIKSPYLE
ncbi:MULTISPECIES: hypothetical protein [Clostridium]|uniref:hypothetical protein n=1 Tax=Clostridium TaxID=1485 RepID=UPI0004D7FDCF|nr:MULTISPECIES: hypothetical protein [Clostridium]KEH85357.1 hypothetical protein Z967_08915 [Clostridium novyi A str. 4540]KEH91078.1 hypothetical protein Z965_07820 [Clostridium novyi A str. BKT29909]KEH91185.1 hypothetical protein Z964_10095 [Clostridium novyi A str. GD211209]KEH93783.1 hypothetical protein Z963_01080 [Clostridium botulinum C/D str. It1]